MANLRQDFGSATEWLFIGCGSSYYIGLAAAATCSAITGKRARAIPASELLLFPDIVLAGSQEIAAVVISRSGRTSETLKAAQFLEREKHVHTLAITSTVGQPLEQIATSTFPLLPSDEESTVMTRSFTSMVLGLQYLSAFLADDPAFCKSLSALPALADTAWQLCTHESGNFSARGSSPTTSAWGKALSTAWPAKLRLRLPRCQPLTLRVFTLWSSVTGRRLL
jgi:glucosamine--fructose-6-phosphate aminotransferase (isomerizing)